MKQLAIIGGGIHGMSIYFNLPEDVKRKTIVIDKHIQPFSMFFNRCNSVQLDYLRSPGSHTLFDPPSNVLYKHSMLFNKPSIDFIGPYFNPSFYIFKHFLDRKVETLKTFEYIQDEVRDMEYYSDENFWHITGQKTTYNATYVILALGSEIPHMPEKFKTKASLKNHVLSSNFSLPKSDKRKKIAVIGGGMSGTQLSIALSQKHEVTLISSEKLTRSQWDSDPKFIGEKHRAEFFNLDIYKRIQAIDDAKRRGSVNPYVYKKLEQCYKKNQLSIVTERLDDLTRTLDETYKLHFKSYEDIIVDEIIFATGLQKPQEIVESSPLLSSLFSKYSLKLAPNGAPLLSSNSFQWHTNLFLAGTLAEINIGPFAGNIIGAQFFYRKMKPVFESLI